MVTGPESARRISELARDEIEEYVRTSILEEDEELARRFSANKERFEELKEARRVAEEKAATVLAEIDSKIANDLKNQAQIESRAKELETWFRQEQERIASEYHALEQEKQAMELAYRRLKEFLSDKGDRLIALGLADAEDIADLLPDLGRIQETREGLSLAEALPGGFAQLPLLLQSRLSEMGLLYTQSQLRDFLALLRTRDLIVLAGDSGSGKTSLVRATAKVLGGECTVIPVKPNWTGPEDLLGYYNPVERCYQATPFLLALQRAASNPTIPHFICLDEMNLARVEHYFADFLSLLEQRSESPEIVLYTSDEERHVVVEQGVFLEVEAEVRKRFNLPDGATLEDILLHDEANAELHRIAGLTDNESVLYHHARLRRSLAAQMRIPTSIKLPENVWIFGAVNMDDTTHHLSPKVLDRVQVLRFRNPMLTDWDAIENEVEKARQALPEDRFVLRMTPEDIGARAEYPAFDRTDGSVAFLSRLSKQYLDPLGVEFGLRPIRQAQGYIIAAKAAGIDLDEALDNVIKHKMLPKIAFDTARPSGSGRPRRDILEGLRSELAQRFAGTSVVQEESCVSDIARMISMAEGNNGIVNYWQR